MRLLRENFFSIRILQIHKIISLPPTPHPPQKKSYLTLFYFKNKHFNFFFCSSIATSLLLWLKKKSDIYIHCWNLQNICLEGERRTSWNDVCNKTFKKISSLLFLYPIDVLYSSLILSIVQFYCLFSKKEAIWSEFQFICSPYIFRRYHFEFPAIRW